MKTQRRRLFISIVILVCVVLCSGVLSGFAMPVIVNNVKANSLAVLADDSIQSTDNNSRDLITKSYQLTDNTGYNPNSNVIATQSLFAKPFANISLNINGGDIIDGQAPNKTDPGYGFVMQQSDDPAANPVSVQLQYNYSSTANITGVNGYKYQFSDDSWKKGVNGNNVGVVGTGALLVSKSTDGSNYSWQNPYSYATTRSFHTINFTIENSPSIYYYQPLLIYTPDGNDLKKGIYIKVQFAYEVKYNIYQDPIYQSNPYFAYQTAWAYINVVEETTFYVCNSSANILFQNIVFSNNEPVISEDAATSSMIRSLGTIANGDATNEGFKIAANGSEDEIKYSKNGATNLTIAQDGQCFFDPGRYDFTVTPKIGTPKKTTIYVNERGTRQNIDKYFPNGLLTANSQRIFTDGSYPEYTAGKTWFSVNAVSQFDMPLVGKIQRVIDQDNYETVAELNAAQSRSVWTGDNNGLLTEPGIYVATFANNPKYFDGGFSGDCYTFVFQFILTTDDSVPTVNQGLLENNLCVSDYSAGYYGVTLPTQGAGNATFAFTNYADAYSFAYNYYSSKVTKQGTAYYFDETGLTYQTQYEVLKDVTTAATSKIERKYFDASDKNSCLTINSAVIDILSQTINKDVVVFSDALASQNMASGLPSLNDKKYYQVDQYNQTTENTVSVRFIQTANFESSSVTLISEDFGTQYQIGYGQPVQSFLMSQDAPSGKYQIVEKNIYGNANTYEAVYVRPGDNQTALSISWTLSNMVASQTLTKADMNKRFTANSFIINSAVNTLDPYGIVKVTKLGDLGWTKTYQLDEVSNIILDEEGNYQIQSVDRLGNSSTYFADIYVAKKVYTLTLTDNGEQLSQQFAFGGQKFDLPTPTNTDDSLEFIGWQDAQGKIYNGTYTFNLPQDVTLTAVWNYSQTTIQVYDGDNIASYSAKPGQKIVLPNISRDQLKLFGYGCEDTDGTITFYIGEITSVPNLPNMDLYATWIDENQTYTSTQPTRDGMTFLGWVSQESILNGTIYNQNNVPSGVTVHSLWIADPSESPESGFGGGAIAGIFKNVGMVVGGGALMLLLTFALIQLINRLKRINFAPRPRVAYKTKPIAVSVPVAVKEKKEVNISIPLPRFKFSKRFGIACIACTMALVMTFTAGYQLIFNIKQKHDLDVKTAINQEYTNKLKEQKAETEKQNEYNAQAQQLYNTPEPAVAVLTGAESSNTNDLEITDEQAFLYSLVFIDLLSFGYDVFPAVAVKQDKTEILGFGYTSYDDIYQKDTDDKIYFGSGFVSLLDQPEITDTDVQDGITINQITDETDQQNDYGFILSFEEQYGPIHYIAFEQYIKYSVQNFGINYTPAADDPSLYDQWGGDLGYLYNYDLGQPVYDPNLGVAFNPDAFSIYQGTDYNAALSLTQNMVFQQDENYLTVDTMNMFYISPQGIADYLANNQDEKFLGVSTDQLMYLEAMWGDTVVYYIDGNQQIQAAQIPPEPNIFRVIMSVAQIAIGGILLVVPGTQAAGAFMIAGGVCGLISEFFMEEIGKIFDAASTVMTGVNCLMVGISLLSCNPFGVALGVTSIIVGGATTLVGLNDLGTVITGVNLIQAITGMSDSAYNWMKMGLTIASTVLTIVGSIYKTQYVKGQQAKDARAAEINAAKNPEELTKTSLQDLADSVRNPGDKTEVHHIVEQCQVNKSGFTKTQIQDESNLITLSKEAHIEVSRYYSKIQEISQGMRYRNWLAASGKTFEEQTQEGFKILKQILEGFSK